MGYTHYWTQRRNFTRDEWEQTTADLKAILSYVENEQGIPLANSHGEAMTRPIFEADVIAFNGLGEDSHESFIIYRKRPTKESWQRVRGKDFCKTARKPYDLAVTACLAYLSTVIEGAFSVRSDGDGKGWLNGVEAVRRALPKWGNVVDIPRAILEQDRWCAPFVRNESALYEMRFCVDGKAYIIRRKDGLARVFDSHAEAARWAAPHLKELLDPSGYFDEARWKRIKAGQTRLFREAFQSAELFHPERLGRPPLYVRPDEFPALPHNAYSIDDLLKLAS